MLGRPKSPKYLKYDNPKTIRIETIQNIKLQKIIKNRKKRFAELIREAINLLIEKENV